MDWETLIAQEGKKEYFRSLWKQLNALYKTKTIYPKRDLVFHALKSTPLNSIKVVILGQDPYHGPNEAHGLCFSVQKGIKIPPSLRNIFKELHQDLDLPIPSDGNLEKWASQGVLLLNTTMTVEHKQPRSHHNMGWQQFTDEVIKTISQNNPYVVFMLWGSDAQSKIPLIDTRHGIIRSTHPSPLSAHRGFLGSRPFSKANELLQKNNIHPIDWCLV